MEAELPCGVGYEVKLFIERIEMTQEVVLQISNLLVILAQFSPSDDNFVGLLRRFEDLIEVFLVHLINNVFLDLELRGCLGNQIDDIYRSKIQLDKVIGDISIIIDYLNNQSRT